jgi:hypothetical protein
MSGRFKAGHHLGRMYRSQLFDCFEFDHETIGDKKIEAAFTNRMALVLDFNHRLPDVRNGATFELNAQRLFVHRFQEARPQGTMDLDRRSNDRMGQIIQCPIRFLHAITP